MERFGKAKDLETLPLMQLKLEETIKYVQLCPSLKGEIILLGNQ